MLRFVHSSAVDGDVVRYSADGRKVAAVIPQEALDMSLQGEPVRLTVEESYEGLRRLWHPKRERILWLLGGALYESSGGPEPSKQQVRAWWAQQIARQRPAEGPLWQPADAKESERRNRFLAEKAGHEEMLSSQRKRRGIPRRTRNEVWRRDDGCCVECGSRERLEFDHIIPWSKGGSDTARNLQLLCERCNRSKSARI